MAGSSSDAGGMDVASEHVAEDGENDSNDIMMNLISFNFGLGQGMLAKRKHEEKFAQLLDTFSQEYMADVVLGCEVGAHKQGMSERQQRSLQRLNLTCTSMENYMIALNQNRVTTKLLREPEVMQFAGTYAQDTQLVLTAVQAMQGTKKAAITVIGNVQSGTASAEEAPTMFARQRLVREALGKLVEYGNMVLKSAPASGRPEIVLVLAGDFNIHADFARQTVAWYQPRGLKTASNVWVVRTTAGARGGDLCFIKGCESSAFEVQVGTSYAEHGMGSGQHDALGVVLSVPVVNNVAAPSEEPGCNTKVAVSSEDGDKVQPVVDSLVEDAGEHGGINKATLLPNAQAAMQGYRDMLETGPRNAFCYKVYKCLLEYFNKRLNQEGISSTDPQLEMLSRLFFAQSQVSFTTDKKMSTAHAASLLVARRLYADMHDVDIAKVTRRTLEVSEEGLNHWLRMGDGPTRDDAAEHVVSMVSAQECATRISRVLSDRWEWLNEQGYPVDYNMSYRDRGEYLKWIMKKFEESPIEAELIAEARRKHKSPGQIKQMVCTHWSLEKQRRAGSSQVWELLSFTGDADPEFLNQALQPQENNSAHERVEQDLESELTTRGREFKYYLRYGKMLQRREQKDPRVVETLYKWEARLLEETKDGTLKRKANTAVIEAGRGRLRGDNDDYYLDIGTNQDRGVVHHILDGKRLKCSF